MTTHIQTLTRAISIDASNPYAYFYLGRAIPRKKELRSRRSLFLPAPKPNSAANPQWLGETLAFEGLVNERSGQTAPAIACYQKALVAVPGNLMARVGLTRLSGEQAAPAIEPASAPAGPPDAASGGERDPSAAGFGSASAAEPAPVPSTHPEPPS